MKPIRTGVLLFFVLIVNLLTGCRVTQGILSKPVPEMTGIAGFRIKCEHADTVRSVAVHKAEAIILFNGDRYESTISIYAYRDSVIYLTAVNGGFEILRAAADRDSIKIIDRVNRVVYRSSFYKRFGYQHPVNFNDLQRILSAYYLCNDSNSVTDDYHQFLVFNFEEPYIRKSIRLDRESYTLQGFEFYHTKTNDYIFGERSDQAMRILSNFMVGDFEVVASGGEISFNQEESVSMHVNSRRYKYFDF